MKFLTNKKYNELLDISKDLDTENIRLEGDLNLCRQFEQIGDEKLVNAYKKIDAYILKINKLKEKYGKR